MSGATAIILALLPPQPTAETKTPLEVQAIAQVQEVFAATVSRLRETLKDNQSARFRKTYFRVTGGVNGNAHLSICGQINAKNSFGAYGGWEPFFGNAETLEIGSDPNTLSAAILCNPNRGYYWMDHDLSRTMREQVIKN